jgi:hypothetical protein
VLSKKSSLISSGVNDTRRSGMRKMPARRGSRRRLLRLTLLSSIPNRNPRNVWGTYVR